MEEYTFQKYPCEGVSCPACSTECDVFTVTETVERSELVSVYGPYRPDVPVTREFGFTPCGCRWTPGPALVINVMYGFPDGRPVPEGANADWFAAAGAPVIGFAVMTPATSAPPEEEPVAAEEAPYDPSCGTPERSRP